MKRTLLAMVALTLIAVATPAMAQQPFWSVTVNRSTPQQTGYAGQTAASAAAARTRLTMVTIEGRATRSTGGVPNSVVRLRDARFGRIVDQVLTDRTGAFAFPKVNPGNYIIELLSGNQTTIAATQLISVNGGETVTAVVRLPTQPSMFAGLLGQQGAMSASLAPSGLADVVPTLVEQLPQVAFQTLPAVLPVGTPASEPTQ